MDMKCTLKDCGFHDDIASQYQEAVETGNCQGQIRALEKQRRIMLEEMHTAAEKVDCIDYMICECKKNMD